MNEKAYNNMFRLSLYQEDVLLCESGFDADQYNPLTRYSIDIRSILPRAIITLQKTLSKRAYETKSYDANLDMYEYYEKMVNLYPKEYRSGMSYNPQSIVQQIDQKTIRGVECKLGFYINNKTIVERQFYVDGFNPIARFSPEVAYAIFNITNDIKAHIRVTDEKNMWDDYDMINILGLSIGMIRELSPIKRSEMIRKLRRN